MKSVLKVGLALALMAGVMCGCDSGGGGDDGGAGLGNVSGTYSFTTDTITWTGSDGSSGTIAALAFNLRVTQRGNTITFTQGDRNATAGLTVIEESVGTGIIETDGAFIGTSTALAQIAGIPGNLTVTYNLDGQFTSSGWSGDYSYIVFAQDLWLTLTYTTTFRGDKQPVAAMTSTPTDDMTTLKTVSQLGDVS